MKRASGILMPLSSLPSRYGIGTMGKSAYEFVDFLKAAGQSYWQLLPLGPTSCGDSPYSSLSTFAGNPNYIDLDMLISDGLLKRSEVAKADWGSDATVTDYDKVNAHRPELLRLAYLRGKEKFSEEIEKFRRENQWVETYALYSALKVYFDGLPWLEWPDRELRLHKAEAVQKYRAELAEEIDFYCFVQMLFFSQWAKLKEYAHKNGIKLIGDIPIYVALDSADLWSEPEFFLLDEEHIPTLVAGCPPDAFTAEGQLWGNPLYDWEKMKSDGFGWWIRRIEGVGKLFDLVRIDHFRGLESFWAVPAGDKTALNGHWIKGPGLALTKILSEWFWNMSFIAEDLGVITDEVRQLVRSSGFPNMAVLQFAFDAQGDSDYLPHNCGKSTVCYVGTHDNDTVMGWVEHSGKEDVQYAKEYMHISEDEGWCWGMIRTGMTTSCELFVVQMQELLGLGGECRMNTPGIANGNWRWRMEPKAATKKLAKKMFEYTNRYRRI